ncbi:MAG: hypothetical protein KBI07_07595 [Candidatus Atribacteria bacterium]|nr:hypothetical protein [Candidatus Atribacteria bacterium]
MNIKKQKNPIGNYLFLIIVLFFSIILSGCQLLPPFPQEEAKWTVMVYLAAGNDLETVGIQDINEMELVGSTEEVNIVVQMDRIPFRTLSNYGMGIYDDFSNGNWTTTRRYYVTQDMNTNIIHSRLLIDLGEQNMGDVETLKDFAQWTIQRYPAERYMLVLWNHGGGFRSPGAGVSKDICWDYNFGLNSKITMPQLEEALTFVQSLLGKKIDIIGMDACYMAMVEVAYQIKDCAQIMVASEASIPPDGWQYDCILESLVANPDQSSRQFASEIVNCYDRQYSGSASGVTLSAVDLAGIDLLAGDISVLANQIINDHTTPKNKYREARNITQHYNSSQGLEYIDLKDFVIKLEDYTYSNQVLQTANQINQTLQSSRVIISNTYCGSSVKNSHGLSIYFPYYSYDNYYNYTNFSQDTSWDEMLFHLGY